MVLRREHPERCADPPTEVLGQDLDVRITQHRVVVSRHAPAVKLDRIRALGATLELVDGDMETARERAAAISRNLLASCSAAFLSI